MYIEMCFMWKLRYIYDICTLVYQNILAEQNPQIKIETLIYMVIISFNTKQSIHINMLLWNSKLSTWANASEMLSAQGQVFCWGLNSTKAIANKTSFCLDALWFMLLCEANAPTYDLHCFNCQIHSITALSDECHGISHHITDNLIVCWTAWSA